MNSGKRDAAASDRPVADAPVLPADTSDVTARGPAGSGKAAAGTDGPFAILARVAAGAGTIGAGMAAGMTSSGKPASDAALDAGAGNTPSTNATRHCGWPLLSNIAAAGRSGDISGTLMATGALTKPPPAGDISPIFGISIAIASGDDAANALSAVAVVPVAADVADKVMPAAASFAWGDDGKVGNGANTGARLVIGNTTPFNASNAIANGSCDVSAGKPSSCPASPLISAPPSVDAAPGNAASGMAPRIFNASSAAKSGAVAATAPVSVAGCGAAPPCAIDAMVPVAATGTDKLVTGAGAGVPAPKREEFAIIIVRFSVCAQARSAAHRRGVRPIVHPVPRRRHAVALRHLREEQHGCAGRPHARTPPARS